MFEKSLQTEEWKDQEAREGRSVGEIESRQLAAGIVAANAVLSIATIAFVPDHPGTVLHPLIALFLAWYLFKLRPRAENLVLGLALITSVVAPIVYFSRLPPGAALFQSFATWGVAGPLLLLLVGEPTVLRRAVAVAIFLVVGCGGYTVLLVGAVLQRL